MARGVISDSSARTPSRPVYKPRETAYLESTIGLPDENDNHPPAYGSNTYNKAWGRLSYLV